MTRTLHTGPPIYWGGLARRQIKCILHSRRRSAGYTLTHTLYIDDARIKSPEIWQATREQGEQMHGWVDFLGSGGRLQTDHALCNQLDVLKVTGGTLEPLLRGNAVATPAVVTVCPLATAPCTQGLC